VSRRTKFVPFLTGGGQEKGRRAGTENVASIVGLGKACELAGENMAHEQQTVRALRDRFEQGLLAKIPGVQVNGDPVNRLPNTSSLAFDAIDSEAVLLLLDQHGICCSSGSACTTGSLHASHVLKAMGFSDDRARSSLRFSFGRFNTEQEVDLALEIIPQVISKLRRA
jgi:cysteine desulfurase